MSPSEIHSNRHLDLAEFLCFFLFRKSYTYFSHTQLVMTPHAHNMTSPAPRISTLGSCLLFSAQTRLANYKQLHMQKHGRCCGYTKDNIILSGHGKLGKCHRRSGQPEIGGGGGGGSAYGQYNNHSWLCTSEFTSRCTAL